MTTTRSDGLSASFDWLAGGKLASVTSGAATGTFSRTTSYAYDSFRRLQTVTSPLGIETGYNYNLNGQLTSHTDGEGLTWGIVYDADGFPRTVRLPDSEIVQFDNSGDSRGLLTSITEGSGSMQLGWDALSRLASITDPLERVTNVQRDLRGLVTSRTQMPAGITTSYARNALGDVIRTTDPLGGEWQRDYDSAGRLATTTDPLGQTSSYDYDGRDRVTGVTRADNSTADYAYDNTGGISSARFSDGTEVTIDRSPQGRVMGGDNLVLGYSINGNLTASNGLVISYDDHDRMQTVTLAPGRILTYAYDRADNLHYADAQPVRPGSVRNARPAGTKSSCRSRPPVQL